MIKKNMILWKSLLGGLSPEAFFKHYWQKKPLLIRQAFKEDNLPQSLGPEELAGLALESEVTSRIVIKGRGSKNWKVQHGPFKRKDFLNLPKSSWTLLVQETDHFVEDFFQLKQLFRFLPDWRMDDVMVSYAAPGGSVGPHLDEYDVFLIQGRGKRRWQIESLPRPFSEDDFIPSLDLRILKTFVPDKEWVLNPGDMLYLPPRVPHHGKAISKCMTYSIGLRAPSLMELWTHHLEDFLPTLTEAQRYTDSDLNSSFHPAEVSLKTIQRVVHLLQSYPPDPAKVQSWFGKLITTSPRQNRFEFERSSIDCDNGNDKDGSKLLNNWKHHPQLILYRDPALKMVFMKKKGSVSKLLLFMNGNEFLLPYSWLKAVKLITLEYKFQFSDLAKFFNLPSFPSFLAFLIHEEYFFFEKP